MIRRGFQRFLHSRSVHLSCCPISDIAISHNISLRNDGRCAVSFMSHTNSSYINFKRISPIFAFPIRKFADYPPHTVITLPNLSPTMETGSIVSWAKNEGDEVNEGDVMAEIETDKATMSFEASDNGFLAKILIPEGTRDVPVRTPLCVMVEEAASLDAFKDFKVDNIPSASPKVASETPPASPQEAPSPALSTLTPPTATQAPTTIPIVSTQPTVDNQRIFASPLARRLAAEQGVDLSLVMSGTGIHGMIRAADLANVSTSGPSALPALDGAFSDSAVSNIRAVIAKRLTESKRTIPHYYLTSDIQMDEVLRMRADMNQSLAKSSITVANEPLPKITVNDIIIKAVAVSCMRIPECNSSWQGDFIRQYNTVDVNVAVATPAGLITPIVFAVETKGLLQINRDVRMLAGKAKENKLQPHEFQGGTFTISNLGMFGISSFSAIINPPQACLLAVGNTHPQLIPDDSQTNGFRTAQVMSATLCCDHRVVDGAVGAQWLAEFKRVLEHPTLMLV